jgi:hypothetical protein
MSKKPATRAGRKFARPLAEAAANEARRLQADPNVACVGFGLKFVKGRPTMQAALQYHVRRKLAGDRDIKAIGSEPIPAEVDGYPTDVVQWSPGRAVDCPSSKSPTGPRGGRREDPLVGGTSTTVLSEYYSFPTGYGTLGGICLDSSSNDAMALSNAHVYGSDIGNDAIQPWLPTDTYLAATVMALTCGIAAYAFTETTPSALTTGLAAAAAGVWAAAAASDAEDPSRWGQRTGPVPPAGQVTSSEQIRIAAQVPRLPFPGREWQAEASWDYARVTSGGVLTTSTTQPRPNEHVLIGKRVLTDRQAYLAGDTVRICAQLFTDPKHLPRDRFVVAHSFPIADPSRITRRVLVPDPTVCRDTLAPGEPICVRGFAPQIPGLSLMCFRIIAPPFILSSGAPTTELLDASEASNPSHVNALRLPKSAKLKIACPPSTHVELGVFHAGQPIEAVAIAANGREVDRASTSGPSGAAETLVLSGLEIVRLELSLVKPGPDDAAYLFSICVDKRALTHRADAGYYTGTFALDWNESPGRWGVMVVSQTIDDTPNGGNPISGARKLGGIVDSANLVETSECVCEVLFDATFDVVEGTHLLSTAPRR